MDSDLHLLPTAVVTLGIVVLCVLFHYEGLRALSRWVTVDLLPPRGRIASLIFGQLCLHLIEIGLFAMGYFLLANLLGYGSIDSPEHIPAGNTAALDLFDMSYYSATVYTTLGFGDLVPTGAVRLLTGTEAVTGLVLITWSASFTFLEMQRYWGRG
jgi:hypothetical protein